MCWKDSLSSMQKMENKVAKFTSFFDRHQDWNQNAKPIKDKI